jgi:hypothetical protein
LFQQSDIEDRHAERVADHHSVMRTDGLPRAHENLTESAGGFMDLIFGHQPAQNAPRVVPDQGSVIHEHRLSF